MGAVSNFQNLRIDAPSFDESQSSSMYNAEPDAMVQDFNGQTFDSTSSNSSRLKKRLPNADNIKHVRGEDSGYVSLAGTPDRPTTREDVAKDRRQLHEFKQEIPQQTTDRFADIAGLLLPPLPKYLSRRKKNFRNISMDLKILGENEDAASPWIVVFCDEEISKRVDKYFKKPKNKLVYQPQDPDAYFPYFELLICNYPPRTKAASFDTEVFEVCQSSYGVCPTLCGSKIAIGVESGGYKVATIGGLVMAISENSSHYELLGMTAGHIFGSKRRQGDAYDTSQSPERSASFEAKTTLLDSEDSENDYSSSGSEDEGDDSPWAYDDEFELILDDDNHDASSQQAGDTKAFFQSPGLASSLLGKVGQAWSPSKTHFNAAKNLDWALVRYDDPSRCLPNMFLGIDVKEADDPLRSHEMERQVFLMTSGDSSKHGALSAGRSYILLDGRQSFADTYKMTFYGGDRLEEGECGAWVVDVLTNQVWGHVVADNAFGEAYVVPMHASLRQMAHELGVASVRLAPPAVMDKEFWMQHRAGMTSDDSVENSPSQDHGSPTVDLRYPSDSPVVGTQRRVVIGKGHEAFSVSSHWDPTGFNSGGDYPLPSIPDSGYASANPSPRSSNTVAGAPVAKYRSRRYSYPVVHNPAQVEYERPKG